MTSLKWILPLVIIAIVVIFLLRPGIQGMPSEEMANQAENKQLLINQEITPESATADIDAFTNNVLLDAQNELSSFDDEGSDLTLFNLDDQAINNLGQSYDEKEF